MRQLPPVVVDFINKKYGREPIKVETNPYWSTVRLNVTFATGVIAVGTRQAFSYGIGSDMALAGRAGTLATKADTNLQKPGETRQNADIFVTGVAAYICQDGDANFFAKIVRECAVEISTDGSNTTPLATLEMLPGGGGLFGAGRSASATPDQNSVGQGDGGEGAVIHHAGNGNPMAGNFFMLDAPVLWTGQTGVDSNFRLILSNDRAITAAPGAARVAAPGGAAGPVGVFTPPAADFGIDVRFRLANFAISRRSVN